VDFDLFFETMMGSVLGNLTIKTAFAVKSGISSEVWTLGQLLTSDASG
jgi:hypothetical protein